MIRAVTFDFWNTLFSDSEEIGRLRQTRRVENMVKVLAKEGYGTSREEVLAGVEAASKQGEEIRLQGIVDFTPEQQIDLICTCLGLKPGPATIQELLTAYTGAAILFPPSPLPGAAEIVREVSNRLPVGLISNTGITPGSVLREVLGGVGILECFKTLTFSNEVILVKPNPQIFLLTAENLQVDPKDVLHIGDDYEADVIGAQKVGAKGVWLNTLGRDKPSEAAHAVIRELHELKQLLWG